MGSGLRRSPSVVFGSLFGMAYQVYVEFEDGFHKDYGSSPGDAIAYLAGAMIPLVRETIPQLRRFAMKGVPSRAGGKTWANEAE